jgi:hypothetical protein
VGIGDAVVGYGFARTESNALRLLVYAVNSRPAVLPWVGARKSAGTLLVPLGTGAAPHAGASPSRLSPEQAPPGGRAAYLPGSCGDGETSWCPNLPAAEEPALYVRCGRSGSAGGVVDRNQPRSEQTAT